MKERISGEAVVHDESARTVYCDIEGLHCEADYEITGSGYLNLVHTFVHPDLRGRGIAADLMKVCSYAVVYYRRHREYARILAPELDLEDPGCCRLPAAD
jgi:uncharacterized protein